MRRQRDAADAPPRRGEHRIGDGGSDDGDADLSQPAGLAVALDELDQYPRALRQARQAELAKLRSEEHTSELQSLMRISYARFCLKNQNTDHNTYTDRTKHKTIPQ